MKVTLILTRFSFVTEQLNCKEKQYPTTINLCSRTVLFWVITQQVVVNFTDVSRQPTGPIVTPEMGTTGRPETSVRNYNSLHNNSEACSSHLLHGGHLKSCNLHISLTNRKGIWQLEKKQPRSYLPR